MVTKTIKVETVTHHVGKSGKPYQKLNGQFFIWEDALADELRANIGKSFELDLAEGNFPKLNGIIGQVAELEVPVVNCTGAPKVPQTYNVDNSKIMNELAKEFILKKESPNSRVFGKGSDQVKLYFTDATDLEFQIRGLLALNLMPKDYVESKADELVDEIVEEVTGQ